MDAQRQHQLFNEGQRPLPNAVATLVLGIVSIPTCICYGVVSIILAVVALALSAKDVRAYRAEPQLYTRGSYNNLTAGRICAIIGLVLGILYLGLVVWIVNKVGLDCMRDPQCLREAFGLRS